MKNELLQEVWKDYTTDPRFDHLKEVGVNFVGGFGNVDAELMLIGEAPGEMENAKRQPFIGPAGLELNKILVRLGMDPFQAYMTNIVKYWPQRERKTRPPTEQEINDSKDYLLREIGIVNPRIVVLCGLSSIKAIFPETKLLRAVNGKSQVIDGTTFISVYHPATLLYSASSGDSARSDLVWRGFKAVRRLLRTD